jgi:diphosphomevalonate decarboxylase
VKKPDVIKHLLPDTGLIRIQKSQGRAYAPTNIALCKYWGKRNAELNLPNTASLSISLLDKGVTTTLIPTEETDDVIILNDKLIETKSVFGKRLTAFLDLFRPKKNWTLHIDMQMNLPVAAGLASSACGFAALVLALNDLFVWQLSQQDLSILARLGSGSATRSLWNGFVEWQAGVQADGMDSHGVPLAFTWPTLNIGILSVCEKQKPLSSRLAMAQTVSHSTLYQQWPKQVQQDLTRIKRALIEKDFLTLAATTEANALAMHATMLSTWPPICYFLPETLSYIHHIWRLRKEGLAVYFTQDAGPNLKLLFLEKDRKEIEAHFPSIEIVRLFE